MIGKLYRALFAFLICSFQFILLKAQYSNIEFIENKGQWEKQIKFSGQVLAGAFYVEQNGFRVLQHNPDEWAKLAEEAHGHNTKGKTEKHVPITVHSHAYKVEFLNGNQNPQIIADKPLPGYNNYFIGNDPSKWAADCKVYQGITMKNVYPNVDVRYYSNNGTVKYDLIVKPGADVSQIALKYHGADKLEIKNKELIIGTSVGDLKELNPYSYQQNEKGKTEVSCKYKLKNNTISFDVKDYDPSSTLIIDPSLVFCSFTGSSADNWGFTATYGPDGSMFGGGIVFDSGFPVSTGAFQTTYGGGVSSRFGNNGFDIGIIKLSPNGANRIYATYIGGSGNEMPQSLVCDPQGNLIIAGRTSSSNYPTFPDNNIGVNNPGGNFDIILTKLNAAGNGLIGSKRIGGSNDDGANITPYGGGPTSLQHNYGDEARSEVILDNAGNVYLASCTQSTNFPTLSPFQSANGGGQDGVVIKMSPDLSTLLFSTYLGGNGDDAAYVLDINPVTGNLYVAGGTQSSTNSFPGNHAGTVGPSNFGGIDGFIAIIAGTSLVRSTFLGTSAYDQIYGIKFDTKGFPYVMGQTMGSWPHINAAYFNNGARQFIAKLQPDFSNYVYSTTFGTASPMPNISPTAFLVDRCENVYVSGWGGGFGPSNSWEYPNAGTTGLPVTADAIKSTTDGRDFYFFVLKRDAASQLYGSFFGENNTFGCDHVDGGTSRFDQNGIIYQAICANCGKEAVFPTTPGVWSTTNPSRGGGECNLALVKIAFNLAGVKSGVLSTINGVPRDSAGCVPLTVDFSDTIQNAVSYEWNFGDGSPQITTTVPTTSHTFNAVGTYKVMLVAIDSATCNIRDTSYVHIRVQDVQAALNFNPVKLNPCDSFKYRFDNLSTASVPFKSTSFIWDFGDGSPRIIAGTESVFHNYRAAGTYNVKLILTDTTYCNAPDSITIQLRVAALVKAQFTTPPAGCAPYNAAFTNTSLAGQTFQWDFGDGSTSTAINPTHLYTTPGNYTITLIANDPGTCNLSDTTRLTIIVQTNPTADFSFSPNQPMENTPTTFTNQSSSDAIRFIWRFGDGDTLLTTSRAAVSHQYNATGSFNACLIAFNTAGCSDTICKQVSALVVPAVDVPNAFTPLSGDINGKVFVRGFGISKMRFIIWNRWGQKVFETNDRNIGWDGKFKGAFQPMDVYAYTLDVEFFDGKRATRKGDITLIR
ncbi:MAG TPA: PKD domain-containing protein [Chitinophagaceae bacterium]|jgi:gliding motility-associated-like protein|nr:PKD domain-containing protein [Chitinophagaceae bacterium]